MAAPPGDPFLAAVRKCDLKLLRKEVPWKPFYLTGMFDPVQLEIIYSLQINTYLSMHACFMRTLMNDVGFWHWYNGGNTHHIKGAFAGLALQNIFGYLKQDAPTVRKRVFSERHPGLLSRLKEDDVKMLKLGGNMRMAAWGLTKHELMCKPTTFHDLLDSIGMKDVSFCSQM